MASDYAGSQFQSFVNGGAPACTPAAAGADAFVKLNVRTIPDTAFQYAQLWLDADDASSLTISTGVQAWNDKSGNARNVSQATVANRPALVAGSLNGRNGIDFNGTSHSLA